MSLRAIAALCLFVSLLAAQRRVDPRNSYNRVICALPLIGQGTAADPKRPKYAPWPATQDPNGIIAFYWVVSDDGKSAVAEFIARNRAALAPILNDKSLKVFEKGRSTRSDIEAAMKAYRKDFDFEKNGMVMP